MNNHRQHEINEYRAAIEGMLPIINAIHVLPLPLVLEKEVCRVESKALLVLERYQQDATAKPVEPVNKGWRDLEVASHFLLSLSVAVVLAAIVIVVTK